MKKKLLLLLILGLFIFCWVFPFHPTLFYRLFHPFSEKIVVQRVFKNEQIFDVMITSQQVTAQLLHRRSDGAGESLMDYDKDAPVLVSTNEAQQVKKLLRSPSSYRWDVGNTCIPDYGVLFNFHSGGQVVRVALCFKCRMLGVFEGTDDAAHQVNFEYIFDPMQKQLMVICKTIFPNDKEIQALK